MKKISLLLFIFISAGIILPVFAHAQKHSKNKHEPKVAAGPDYDDSTAEELPVPDPIGLVSDYGHVFSKGQLDTLNMMIQTFKDSSGDEIAIAVWDTLHLAPEEMEAYVKKLSDAWGVGDKEKGNGIIIAFAVNLKRLRVFNSTGGLTDKDGWEVVHKVMMPYFAVKNYYAGMVKGLDSIMLKLKPREE